MKYTIKVEEQIIEVEISDLRSRPIIAIVDGEPIEVWPESGEKALSAPPPALAEKITSSLPIGTGVPTAGSVDISAVRAPIPGNIVAVNVKSGDKVTVGQELCVLEAMKMRNAIRSGRSGTISAVHVAVGKTVLHNDLLFEFAD